MASARRSSERRPLRLAPLVAALAFTPACAGEGAKANEAPSPGASPSLPAAPKGAVRFGAPRPEGPTPRPGLPPGVLSIALPPSGGPFGTTSVHAIALDATHLFFNDGFGRIWGARNDGSGAPFEVLPGAGPGRVNPASGLHATNLIADGDDIVFASGPSLFRVGKSGGTPRALISGKHDPVSLAADEGHVYFSSFDGSPVKRVPKAGGEPVAAFAGIKSGDIGVDATHLYVASYERGTLARAPKAGGRPSTLASGLPKPVGLAVDDEAVFVACEADGSVRRVPKAGGPSKFVARSQANHDSLALDRDYVYWASWEEGGPLRRARKDGSSPPETLLRGLKGPEGIAVDGHNVYVANKGAGEVLVVPKAGVAGAVTYP